MSEITAGWRSALGRLLIRFAGVIRGRPRRKAPRPTSETFADSLQARRDWKTLSCENTCQRFEIRWLRSLAEARDPWLAVLRLLVEATPTPSSADAWLMSQGGRVLLNKTGHEQPPRPLQISSLAMNAIRSRGNAELRGGDFELESRERLFESRLFGFQCGTGEPSDPVLLLSQLPSICGDEELDRNLVARLLREIQQPNSAVPAINEWSEQETALVRDMLELRTVTDIEFSTPHQLLEEFLTRLAMLTGFERASLYLEQGAGTVPSLHFASGGRAVDPQTSDLWYDSEALVIDSPLNRERTVYLCPESLGGLRHEILFQSGLIVPVMQDSRQIGALLLSHRQPVQPDSLNEELVRWAAQYLLQTLEREIDRIQLEEQARRDALTQVANRRTFDQEFRQVLQRCSLTHGTCSLLLVDVDHFKSINDCFGHPCGDIALRSVAQLIQRTVQRSRIAERPLVARFGGEEFAVLLPDVSGAGARLQAEEILQTIDEQAIQLGDQSVHITVSIGVGTSPVHGADTEKLLAAVDAALYTAKREGRNRVVQAGTVLVPASGVLLTK